MSDFENELAKLVATELPLARTDPERLARMMESLLASAGLVVAVGTHGDPEGINTMLEGMTAYLYEAAAEKAPVAQRLYGRSR